MFPFDKMFDFDNDGILDAYESGVQYMFLDEMEREEEESEEETDKEIDI